MLTINCSADLEALRGTPAFADALVQLAGALVTKTNIATYPASYQDADYSGPAIAPVWHYSLDNAVLARLVMTRQDFDVELAHAALPPVVVPEDEGLPLTRAALDAIDAAVRAPRVANVIAERDRRLAAGFDYDFGDARGVHHIGTTADDLKGWDEVSKLAAAMLATGTPDGVIVILTDTGVAPVTATEWQAVQLAAAAFRQPIWQASFVLAAMNPIPADYATNGAYWPG
jgi:hypothetical protein